MSRQELERYCYLDDEDRRLIAARRRDYNRLGFAVQVVTVRHLGMFLADPLDVPPALIEYLAEQLEIRYQPGVAVVDVAEGSPADDAGLSQGDVIIEINAKPARTIKDCEDRLKEHGATDKPLLLLVSSGGSVRYVAVRPPKS